MPYVLHWKFYMNESSILISTQHPLNWFYNCSDGTNVGTIGYDIKIKGSSKIIEYFNNVYQYFWINKSVNTSIKGADLLPCISDDKGFCDFDYKQCNGCYKGGKGYKSSPYTKTKNNKICNIIFVTILSIIIIICIFFLVKS